MLIDLRSSSKLRGDKMYASCLSATSPLWPTSMARSAPGTYRPPKRYRCGFPALSAARAHYRAVLDAARPITGIEPST